MDFYYLWYNIRSGRKGYRVKEYADRLSFLAELDRWNAVGRGEWQYHSVTPGYSAPRDLDEYERGY